MLCGFPLCFLSIVQTHALRSLFPNPVLGDPQLEKQQKPHFKKKVTSVRLKRFGPVHFECRLTPIGDPTMVVEWLHDGKPLEAANRLRMINEFGYCSLDYEVAYSRDSGVVTCRATNKFGVDQTSATLIVKDEKGLVEETQLPEGRKGMQRIEEMERMAHEGALAGVTAEEIFEKTKPEIVLLPEPVRVLEGDTARFRCRVTGYPTPKVNWYLNGQLIRKIQEKDEFTLIISQVKVEHKGQYSCTATNSYGHSTSSTFLHVHIEERRKILQKPPPRFILPIASLQCIEGGEAQFQYNVTGEPLTEVKWFKGSHQIQPSSHYTIQKNPDGFGYLQLHGLQMEDSGLYTCQASNPFGDASCSAELIVCRKRCWQTAV
uniref:Ig-like domain-containing protein n=1 Tax=Paramormyrops kingsleyae TaxID=1676925 RepID=A0A3B3QAU3_9TELE